MFSCQRSNLPGVRGVIGRAAKALSGYEMRSLPATIGQKAGVLHKMTRAKVLGTELCDSVER